MKNSNYLFFYLFLASIIISGCEKDDKEPSPLAGFTCDKYSVKINETVTFTNLSKNAKSYTWNFGDGAISTDENPQHTYQTAGIYQVTLTAINSGGTNTITGGVNVTNPVPLAGFSMSKDVAKQGESIEFTNTSTYAETYLWNFGDGDISNENNPTHTYNEVGNYEISLTATGLGGIQTIKKNIEITLPDPIAAYSINKNGAIVGEKLLFTNNSQYASNYEWDFGDGVTSTEENPSHVFLSDGSFVVKLKAIRDGVENIITQTVNVSIGTNIFPGVGILNVSLGDSWYSINNILKGRTYGFYQPSVQDDYIVNIVGYDNPDMDMFFLSGNYSQIISDYDELIVLQLFDNFIGKTEKNIQMGSYITSVLEAYGSPDQLDAEQNLFFYDNLGICFGFNESDDVDWIVIYYPDAPSTTMKSSSVKNKIITSLLNSQEFLNRH